MITYTPIAFLQGDDASHVLDLYEEDMGKGIVELGAYEYGDYSEVQPQVTYPCLMVSGDRLIEIEDYVYGFNAKYGMAGLWRIVGEES